MVLETWAEIDLDAIAHNIEVIKKLAKTSELLVVLKADAYGHGAPEVMKLVMECGVKRFAVANFFEAMQLRAVSREAEILVFGYIGPGNLREAIDNGIMLTIFSREYWETVRPFIDRPVKLHIKVNTGMNRLGFDAGDSSYECVKEIASAPNVTLESIYSHLALTNLEEDKLQYKRLMDFVSETEKIGVHIPKKHIADSIASVIYDDWMHIDMMRVGALIYGLRAAGHSEYDKLGLRTSLKMFASVSQVRTLKKGEGVSYDYLFRAPQDMKVATLTFGYVDGIQRRLCDGGYVLINGQRAPLLGLMCMDQCVVDITECGDVKQGDKALLYDIEQFSDASVYDMAKMMGSNKNEIISSLGKRVPRVYKRNGKEYGISYIYPQWEG